MSKLVDIATAFTDTPEWKERQERTRKAFDRVFASRMYDRYREAARSVGLRPKPWEKLTAKQKSAWIEFHRLESDHNRSIYSDEDEDE